MFSTRTPGASNKFGPDLVSAKTHPNLTFQKSWSVHLVIAKPPLVVGRLIIDYCLIQLKLQSLFISVVVKTQYHHVEGIFGARQQRLVLHAFVFETGHTCPRICIALRSNSTLDPFFKYPFLITTVRHLPTIRHGVTLRVFQADTG